MAQKFINTATIKFKVNDKPHSFDIATDMIEYGHNIEDAVYSWVHRTKKYTAESFCEYVKSKDPAIICIPADKLDPNGNTDNISNTNNTTK
jgi:hypothetical protein